MDSLPPEIITLIFENLAIDLYATPTSPTQILHLAATCKQFRTLIYPKIWHTLEYSAPEYSTLETEKTLLLQFAHSYTCLLSNWPPVDILKGILSHVKHFKLPTFLSQIRMASQTISAYRLIQPEFMPKLSRVYLTAVPSDAWDKLYAQLCKYPSPVEVHFQDSIGYSDIPSEVCLLMRRVAILVPSYHKNPPMFKKMWKTIGQMRNLMYLSVISFDDEEDFHHETKAQELIAKSFLNLNKLEAVYFDYYPIPLATNIAWIPRYLTDLECSTSNFIADPNGPETDIAGPSLFQTVKKLTIIIICDQPIVCTRLPFRQLTVMNVIGQKNRIIHSPQDVNSIITNLLNDNPKLETFSGVIVWDIHVDKVDFSSLKALSDVSLIFRTTESHTLIKVFNSMVQLKRLTRLSLQVPISSESRELVTYEEFVRFAYSTVSLKILDLCVQLICSSSLEFARLQKIQQDSNLSYDQRTEFMTYLPIKGIENGIARRYFHFKDLRESLSFGKSWMIYFIFDAQSFRLDLDPARIPAC